MYERITSLCFKINGWRSYRRIGTEGNGVIKEQCSTINFRHIEITNKWIYTRSFIRIIIYVMCYTNTIHTTMAPFTLTNDCSHEALLVRLASAVTGMMVWWCVAAIVWVGFVKYIAILFVNTRLNHYSGVIKYKNERDLNAVPSTINSSISFMPYSEDLYTEHAFKRIEFINRHDCESHTYKRANMYMYMYIWQAD